LKRFSGVVLNWAPWVIAVGLLVAVAVYLVLTWGNGRLHAAAKLDLPRIACGDDVVATFSWTPASDAVLQWLDLSLFDNGFEDGTFLGVGPLEAQVNVLTWPGLEPGLPHYWRINVLTTDAWAPSQTGAFVPCGGPELIGVTSVCALERGLAVVTFHWVPGVPAGLDLWLDLTVSETGFEEETFVSLGPLDTSARAATRGGVYANVVHYWRLNTLTDGGWLPTEPQAFMVSCLP
jgi:hypothetical protein